MPTYSAYNFITRIKCIYIYYTKKRCLAYNGEVEMCFLRKVFMR